MGGLNRAYRRARLALLLTLLVGLLSCSSDDGPAAFRGTRRAGRLTTTVRAGETAWRISQNYGVALEEVIRVNRIADVRSIPIGARLFIPDPKRPAPARLIAPGFEGEGAATRSHGQR